MDLGHGGSWVGVKPGDVIDDLPAESPASCPAPG